MRENGQVLSGPRGSKEPRKDGRRLPPCVQTKGSLAWPPGNPKLKLAVRGGHVSPEWACLSFRARLGQDWCSPQEAEHWF